MNSDCLTDPGCLKEHLELVEKMTGHKPKNVVVDRGYGSEVNYLHHWDLMALSSRFLLSKIIVLRQPL